MYRIFLFSLVGLVFVGCSTTTTISKHRKGLGQEISYYQEELKECYNERDTFKVNTKKFRYTNAKCKIYEKRLDYFTMLYNADKTKAKADILNNKAERYADKIKSQSSTISSLENALRVTEFNLKDQIRIKDNWKAALDKSEAIKVHYVNELTKAKQRTEELENKNKNLSVLALEAASSADKSIEALQSESSETMFLELASRKKTVISKTNFGYTFGSKAGYDSRFCQSENFGHKICPILDFPQKFVSDQKIFLHFDKKHGLYEIRSLIPNTDHDFVKALLYRKYGAPTNKENLYWEASGRTVYLTENLDEDVMIVYRGENYDKAREALKNRRANGL